MTLQEIITILQDIALAQPNVRSVGEGDIYDSLNAEGTTKYAYFFITQNRHQQTETTDLYNLNVFYIDRLEDDKSNKLQIQSIGKEVLGNVFNAFCDDFDADMGDINYQSFTERFSDMCAGVYATVTFEVMRESDCAEYFDGRYIPNIPIKILNQTKSEVFTRNGIYEVTYDDEYTGLETVQVEVAVDVQDYYNEGYSNGFSDGETEGYGQGYTNGYTQGEIDGKEAGYADGFTNGEADGRQQVYNESQDLYVTENGVYDADNLFNRVEVALDLSEYYDKGYEDGTNAASADAVVLDVTSNGTVYTKYAELPEWTEPATGDDFYSYASMNGTVYDTGYVINENSVVEFWYRKPGYAVTYTSPIGGSGIKLQKYILDYKWYLFYYKISSPFEQKLDISSIVEDGLWHHYKISETGIWIDDEQFVEDNLDLVRNQNNFTIGGWNNDNGEGIFGMVKLDDNVYIPTNKGYQLVGGDDLPIYSNKKNVYVFTQVLPPVPLENLIKQVNVDIPLSLKQGDGVLKFAYSTFSSVPKFALDGVTDLKYQFQYCQYLTDVSFLGTLNMNGIASTKRMFENASTIVDLSPLRNWDVSTITDMEGMFYYCGNIEDFSFMETWDTSNLKDAHYIFYRCIKGNNIPALNASSFNTNQWFGSTDLTALTNFGGFIGLKYYDTTNYGFYRTPNLTYESWLNVIDGLYDFTGNAEPPSSTQGKLKLHPNAYNLLTDDDIARVVGKGWVLS